MHKKGLKIVCVLRNSAVYDVLYVRKLMEQAERYCPRVPFVCISDVDVPCARIPMKHFWPGWWSKMELFRPDILGDIFFLDLDTMICDEIWDLLGVNDMCMLTDFYRPAGLGSGLMYLPQSIRNDIWREWVTQPSKWMMRYKRGGDQAFIESLVGNRSLRWQEQFPNRVISYKAHHVAQKGVLKGTGILCFHGKPKPRDIDWQVPGLPFPAKE